jgi:uncharacterized protein
MTKMSAQTVLTAAQAAGRMIPPAWPLAATVAVNPFLGQTGENLAAAGARLSRVGGVPVTMPRAWYTDRIASGEISDADLSDALALSPSHQRPADLAALKAEIAKPAVSATTTPTVADLAQRVTSQDWPGIIADRIGVWASAHFDQGQALWAAARGTASDTGSAAFTSWRSFAMHDLTPEIAGLKGFAAYVAATPQRADEALARSVERLSLSEAALPTMFHNQLMTLAGWAQVARWRLWQAEMANGTDDTLTDLLAIRLVFEEALLELFREKIGADWDAAVAVHASPLAPGHDQVLDAILQEATERSAQRSLAATMALPRPLPTRAARPQLQAAFCIDVRSEVYRRALESVGPAIETIGFAGFFGLPLSHRRFASTQSEAHLPVLLSPAVRTCVAVDPAMEAQEEKLRVAARAKRAWGRFKLAAVSSFAFVEAAGPIYAGKLVQDSLGLDTRTATPDPAPRLDPALGPETRLSIAETVLRAMSMTDGFGRIVLLAGHGANVVNNPHASALHCGACGGQTGEVSARVLAELLNDSAVRKGLLDKGITIPPDTLFVAGLHDTTTDELTLFDAQSPAPSHAADIDTLKTWLTKAAVLARTERALRLPQADTEAKMVGRSKDWSQVRPEWGLAGCMAFIAAPRSRTSGRSLEGRAFLHSYDWQADKGFGVLELIMTAPVVVASWISLQYYGSTVAPATFGAGNKLLHNVVGGIGVLEGNGGAPRVGLPWQSVHDGAKLMHDPLRLSVMIEAPREAMSAVLEKHPGVRELFDNRWLHLFALDSEGRMAWRYTRDLQWEAMPALASSVQASIAA